LKFVLYDGVSDFFMVLFMLDAKAGQEFYEIIFQEFCLKGFEACRRIGSYRQSMSICTLMPAKQR